MVKAEVGDCGVDSVSDLVDDSVSYREQHSCSRCWFILSIKVEVDRERAKLEQVEGVTTSGKARSNEMQRRSPCVGRSEPSPCHSYIHIYMHPYMLSLSLCFLCLGTP